MDLKRNGGKHPPSPRCHTVGKVQLCLLVMTARATSNSRHKEFSHCMPRSPVASYDKHCIRIQEAGRRLRGFISGHFPVNPSYPLIWIDLATSPRRSGVNVTQTALFISRVRSLKVIP